GLGCHLDRAVSRRGASSRERILLCAGVTREYAMRKPMLQIVFLSSVILAVPAALAQAGSGASPGQSGGSHQPSGTSAEGPTRGISNAGPSGASGNARQSGSTEGKPGPRGDGADRSPGTAQGRTGDRPADQGGIAPGTKDPSAGQPP